MGQTSCELNRAVANLAIMKLEGDWIDRKKGEEIHRGRLTLYQLEEYEINRFLVCGPCPNSNIDPQTVKSMFREGIDNLIHRVDVFQEYGFDPEVSRRRKLDRQAKWRSDNREAIQEKRETERLTNRIEQLKAQIGGDND